MPIDYWFICRDCHTATYRYRNLKACPKCKSHNVIRAIECPVKRVEAP